MVVIVATAAVVGDGCRVDSMHLSGVFMLRTKSKTTSLDLLIILSNLIMPLY